jgi:hypothetical protein
MFSLVASVYSKKMVFSLFLVCGFDIKKLAIKQKGKIYLRLVKKYLNCLSGPTNASQDFPGAYNAPLRITFAHNLL